MNTRIDHLVVGAASLEQGVTYIKEALGVEMPYGGAHVKMGTHNHLMQLGNNIFLEVIAIDNSLQSPMAPRWYGLDDPYIKNKIEEKPALLTWVVNTKNIAELIQQASFDLGSAVPVSRGQLNWYFGLPEDGRLLGSGMLPYAIEWQSDAHPSLNMADLNCSLIKLEIYHPYAEWLTSSLESIGALSLVEINILKENSSPYLVAHVTTPAGIKKLHSHF